MRIAVVQLTLQPRGRTLTFQAALKAIDAAAESDPAPDLICLPAFADVLDSALGRNELCEQVEGQTTAACGQRARSWGLFVTFGLAERGPDRPYVTSVLLDRDGDVRLAQRQLSFHESTADYFQSGEGLSGADILLGRLALLTGHDLVSDRAWDQVVRSGAQLVVGTACWSRPTGRDSDPNQTRKRIAEQAGRASLWCAVADVTTEGASAGQTCPGLTTIINDQGEIVAAASQGEPATLRAEIDLPERVAYES